MNKRAQSIVEYALIALIVILGIYFMGGYVLRSVNAHFKLWDEGTQDSFSENINQASPNAVPPIYANCQCTQVPENCGNPQIGTSLCPAYQREVDLNCTIEGCAGKAGASDCSVPGAYCDCENDSSCCSCPTPAGCGAYALQAPSTPGNPATVPANYGPVTGPASVSSGACVNAPIPVASNTTFYCQAGAAPLAATCPPGSIAGSTCACPAGSAASTCVTTTASPSSCSCCSQPPANAPSPCYYGYQAMGYQCGGDTPELCVQVASSVCPEPACQSFNLFPGSFGACNGQIQNYSDGLTQNTPVSLVDQASCNCTTDADCPQSATIGSGQISTCQGNGTCSNCTQCGTGGAVACQSYCKPPFYYNPQLNTCDLQFYVASSDCSASTNEADTANIAPTGCDPNGETNLSPSCSEFFSCAACTSPPCCGSEPVICNNSSNNWSCSITINNQSYTASQYCAAPSVQITGLSLSAINSATIASCIKLVNGGCGDSKSPHGEPGINGKPGQLCDITFQYGGG